MFTGSALIKLLSVFLINVTIRPCLSIPIYNVTLDQRLKYVCEITESYDKINHFSPISIHKSKITDNQKGIPLHLIIRVIDATTCSPLPDVCVDIWHANAVGQFSNGQNREDCEDFAIFLRGRELTNSQGDVRFTTIVPGWNQDAVTIHIQVSFNDLTIYTGRLFFDENLPDGSKLKSTLTQTEPYASNNYLYKSHDDDPIYLAYFSYGDTLLSLTKIGTGFQTIVSIVMDLVDALSPTSEQPNLED